MYVHVFDVVYYMYIHVFDVVYYMYEHVFDDVLLHVYIYIYSLDFDCL